MQQSFYSEKEMLADALTAEKTATTLVSDQPHNSK